MRGLARRLGVVPGALYRHVRSKEQLHDLILDAVLAEVDCRADPAQPWTAQVTMLAHRLRAVLENHPGIAALLKARDPLSPASLAFRLIYDYTLGFALADPASPAEQRLRDSTARQQLHAFLRSLPVSSFPTLAAHGTHAWADDREQRFTSGLDTLIRGLQTAPRSPGASRESWPDQPADAGQPTEMSPPDPDLAR